MMASRTQKALRLMTEELRSQRVLLEKLLDGVILHEASIKGISRSVGRTEDLVRGLQVVVGDHLLESRTNKELQNAEITRQGQRLRALETARGTG
jgi:hypothetical protein